MVRADILKVLEEFKEKNGDKYGILALGIFGSVARDEAKDESDVDVFIKTKTPDPFNIVHIKEELERSLKKHVDIVRLRKKMNSFLRERIEKDAVYV